MDPNATNVVEKLLIQLQAERNKSNTNAIQLQEVCDKFNDTMQKVSSTFSSPKPSSTKFDPITYHGLIQIENIDAKSFMNKKFNIFRIKKSNIFRIKIKI